MLLLWLAAVLAQYDADGQECVIQYASRSITAAESKWPVQQLEQALAVIWAFRIISTLFASYSLYCNY